jgi:hypothetical protein
MSPQSYIGKRRLLGSPNNPLQATGDSVHFLSIPECLPRLSGNVGHHSRGP